MERREFLKNSIGCSLLLALPLGCQQTGTLYDWRSLAQWTTGMKPDLIKQLGDYAGTMQAPGQWREELPVLPNVRWLDEGATSADEPEALMQTLSSESRRQFASSHSVIVDGWVLSRLEAALCALAESRPA